jgi:hypothetical protein
VRAFLDGNVVAIAATQPSVADRLRGLKGQAYEVLLGPTVVTEIGAAPLDARRRLVACAIQLCDGFTEAQAPTILAREIATRAGEPIPTDPVVPILSLAPLLEPYPQRGGGVLRERRLWQQGAEGPTR